MISNPDSLYQLLVEKVSTSARVEQVLLGLSWSFAAVATAGNTNFGLCYSPVDPPRVLPWSGTLRGRSARELAPWIRSWNACEATVANAVINGCVNTPDNPCLQQSLQINLNAAYQDVPHLAVFAHFLPQLTDARVAIIGRYPGIEKFQNFKFDCIERRPGPQDKPDSAAEFILPQCDWVFITASSIANKTVLRLLQLSRDATVVLMGPSLTWLEEWSDFGVDYLAGVEVVDASSLSQVVAEGGGTRLFVDAVRYRILSLS